MTGFFAILDDIAALMDDVAVMAKVATRKTAGVLGDDLAVGAEKASSFRASRELPVLWAITKGSFLNKLLILPFAFLLTAYAPQFIIPILLIGGVYLSFEGVEKVIHTFFHKKHKGQENIQTITEEELLII
jgi:predicted DNA repair protein MutK